MLLHPIFSVIVRRPQLLVEHLAAYGSLVHQEASVVGNHLVRRIVAWGVAVLSFSIFLTLAGVAAMIGVTNGEPHWVLFVIPGLALLVTMIAAIFGVKPLPPEPFKELKAQVEADARALRVAGDDE